MLTEKINDQPVSMVKDHLIDAQSGHTQHQSVLHVLPAQFRLFCHPIHRLVGPDHHALRGHKWPLIIFLFALSDDRRRTFRGHSDAEQPDVRGNSVALRSPLPLDPVAILLSPVPTLPKAQNDSQKDQSEDEHVGADQGHGPLLAGEEEEERPRDMAIKRKRNYTHRRIG